MPTLKSFALACTAALALFAPGAAPAQQISCVQPANCALKVTSEAGQHFLTVRVLKPDQSPADETPVTFEVTKGSGSVTSPVTTDANGVATTLWVPSGASPYPAEIRVSANVAPHTPTQLLQLSHTRTTASTVAFPEVSGNYQAWYEDRQLSRPLRVEIRGPQNDEECRRAAVSFRAIGGGGSAPDTVYGDWDADNTQRCMAEAWWRLGKGVGRQALRASLAGESAKGVNFFADARALPRVIAGLAVYRTHSFSELVTAADTIQVARELPGQNTVITYDSSIESPGVKDTDAETTFAPTIGVDFPVIPTVRQLRVSLATSMLDPTNNAFIGFSIPQVWRGLSQESVGFDFHLTLHVQRQKTLRNPTACELDADQCGTTRRLRYGLSLVGVADASGVIGNLQTLFGIK
jgi:hypothetical protein